MDDKGGQKSEGKPKTKMDKDAAARIQSAEAKKNDGKVEKGGFAARAHSAADKNEAAKEKEVKNDTMDDKGSQKSEGKPKTKMDKDAAARIQSAEAKKNDGKVEKGGFAARAQSAADKNEAAKEKEVKSDAMDDKGGQKSEGKPKTEMDKEAAARIRSAEAKKNDGKVEKGGFATRAAEAKKNDGKVEKGSFAPRSQRAADKNEAAKDEEGK